ncbi:hypothetical protein Y1Q_0016277 [Alligator mississippiensis]|uniref:Reverse transcriptase domain-containing protein n=1 Tax=Alligator mississippiensis TaxID=8496 RepID=A0A151M431_ALLMI|nr:hypothetical protein Y1Q_0016277 [Alligator mississippiensis]
MTCLKDGARVEYWSKDGMLETVAAFYWELYAERPVNLEAMQECLWGPTQTLGEADQQQLEEKWTLEEVERTLWTFKNGRTLGSDGLPNEFYEIFWDLVSPDLLELFQEQLQEGHVGAGIDWGLVTEMLYMDMSSEGKVIGFLSARIMVESGVHQGYPLSLILFICTVEPLAQCIRQNPRMNRVQIPDGSRKEIRDLAYMDDLNILCQNKWSVERFLWHTQVYEAATGAKFKVSNSICLATGELRDLEFLGVSVPCEGAKILGMEFDPEVSSQKAWKKTEAKMFCKTPPETMEVFTLTNGTLWTLDHSWFYKILNNFHNMYGLQNEGPAMMANHRKIQEVVRTRDVLSPVDLLLGNGCQAVWERIFYKDLQKDHRDLN